MASRWGNLVKLHRKVKTNTATEEEKRRYRILLKEEASSRKAYSIYSKLPKKKKKR